MPIHRTIKNVVKNHTLAEVKVREATSNDPWGPSTTLMSQIADLTYNGMAFAEVMSMLWKRMNDHGKNWRHVYKSLVLLDYLLKTGSEQVADHCRDNIHHVRTLRDFQHVEEGKDHGVSVRERAKQIVSLLEDDARYRSEREKTLAARERYAQNTGIKITNRTDIRQMPPSSTATQRPSLPPNSKLSKALRADLEAVRPSSLGEEDLQLQVALAMSREEHQDLEMKRKADLLKVQMAVKESRKTLADAGKPHLHAKSESPPRLPPPFSTTTTSNGPKPASNADQHSTDPWTPGPSASKPSSTATLTSDPWSPVTKSFNAWSSKATVSGTSTTQTDPWGVPIVSSAAQVPANNGMNSAKDRNEAVAVDDVPASSSLNHLSQRHNVDDEFDQLGSRFRAHLSLAENSASVPTHRRDSDAGIVSSSSPWDISNSAFGAAETQRKKTAEEFLGTSANHLVNLKELVARPPPMTVCNPFAMTSSHPLPSVYLPSNQVTHGQSAFHHLPPSALPPSYPAPSQMTAQPTPVLTAPGWQTSAPPYGQQHPHPSSQLQPYMNSKNPFL